MKELIRLAYNSNADLSTYVRAFLKNRPKEKETGIYNGN